MFSTSRVPTGTAWCVATNSPPSDMFIVKPDQKLCSLNMSTAAYTAARGSARVSASYRFSDSRQRAASPILDSPLDHRSKRQIGADLERRARDGCHRDDDRATDMTLWR